MALSSGTKLGAYEIHSALGAGGMGEVYQARDSKLGRAVAIKVLPDAFQFDADRISRFEREAKALAALNHPHIAALYGMEQSAGRHFLVMELVEGETLADRLRRGALPVEEALKIALQIAEALEAAHEKGIVHRDLKPANVKITPEEKVKVLDFGLAKALETAPAESNVSHSPTLSFMATQAGVILGTASYMSPEQAKGFPADQRSDVFSFGVVLYEMLTGRQPFQGDTAPDVLASVLVRDPDFTALPPNLNPRLVEILRRALDKHPKRRWQAIGDLRAELEAVAASPRAAAAPPMAPPRPLWKRALPVAAAAVVASAITAGVAWRLWPVAPARPIVRFPLTLGDGQQFTFLSRSVLAISPNGTQIVYVANARLNLRAMSDLEGRAIPGTETNPGNPVFSPDGRSIAFFSGNDQTLKRIAVTGGAAITVCPSEAGGPFGLSWDKDIILFGKQGAGIVRVSANGGKPVVVIPVKNEEIAHGPQILPGGTHVLFTLAPASGLARWDTARIVAHSLETGEQKIVLEGGSDARYLPTGHLVYAHGGVLFAVPFDLRRLEVTGGPVPILEGVRRATVSASAFFSVSDTGTIVYIPGAMTATSGQLDLGLIDRKGGIEPFKLPPGGYRYPRVSPDGKRVAFEADDRNDTAVWIYELAGTSSMRRLTLGGRNRYPVWSADGQRVAFQSDREGDLGIFWQRADGSSPAERLTKPEKDASHVPEAWSPKDDTLLFTVTKDRTTSLWTLSLKDKKSEPFGGVQSTNPTASMFSPDGRWITYAVYQAGTTSRIFVQPFPATGARYQVTKDSGHHPLWSADGKELFYVPAPGQFMMVAIATQPSFTFSNPTPVPRGFPTSDPIGPRNYDMTRDGKYTVAPIVAGQVQPGAPLAPQLHVVLNWFEDLKQRVRVP